MFTHLRPRLAVAITLILLLPVIVFAASAAPRTGAMTVADVEFLGEVVVPTGAEYGGTEIGGLSSITYDAGRGVYYALSDDQGNRPTGDPVRYYTIAIDVSDGSLDAGDVIFTEIMYDTSDPLSESSAEWFEVYNTTGETLDLYGCTIGDHTKIGTFVEIQLLEGLQTQAKLFRGGDGRIVDHVQGRQQRAAGGLAADLDLVGFNDARSDE